MVALASCKNPQPTGIWIEHQELHGKEKEKFIIIFKTFQLDQYQKLFTNVKPFE